MNWIIENWYVVLGLITVIVMIIFVSVKFFNMPTSKQIEALKEWLKFAVTTAEAELGSKTGQLKLRYVYDLAISKFPWVAKVINFEEFSLYVDEALIWLKEQLKSNEAMQNLVNNKEAEYGNKGSN